MRTFPELRDLPQSKLEEFHRLLVGRNKKLACGSAIASLIALFGYILLCGILLMLAQLAGLLQGLDLSRLDWLGQFLLTLAVISVGLTVIGLIDAVTNARLLRRAINDHLDARRCLWCGYCLTGLESSAGRVRCPECGGLSPVRV